MIRRLALLLTIASSFAGLAQAQAQAPAPSDAARIAAARDVVGQLFPTGTYRRMMAGVMDKMMAQVTDEMLDLPLKQFATMGGASAEQLAKLPPSSLRQIMAIVDPAYDQRMQITMQTMTAGLTDLLTQFEPEIRDGMALAYASHFSQAQLAELKRFFATPTGAAYASQSMTLATDPQVMAKMQAIVPRIIGAMPALAAKAQEQTASLPKPHKIQDLSPADQDKLRSLLGMSASKD